ncbi:MAG: hypothetical protein ABIC91_01620, partial [Nanoarchaeota archaeon]
TKNMKRWVAEKLNATNEFSDIDENPNFKENTTLDQALNIHSERQILAIKKPEFVREGESDKYLVITSADLMKIKEVGAKLAAATNNDINTTHILYKFLNSEGDFFRRLTRVDQTKDDVNYREKYAYAKKSLAHIDHVTRNSIFNLSEMEREIVKKLTNNQVAYYQPESQRLEEKIKLVEFEKVKAKYDVDSKKPVFIPNIQTLKKYAVPTVIFESENFTLLPMHYEDNDWKIDQLEYAMRGKFSLRKTLQKPLRVARVLTLPDIDCNTEEEIKLRYNLAIQNEQIQKNPQIQNIEYLTRINEQLKENPQFENVYQALQESYKELDEKKLKSAILKGTFPKTYYATYRSKSEPNKIHTTSIIMPSTNPDEWEYKCTGCKGFQYWNHCWHTDRVREQAKDLLNR